MAQFSHTRPCGAGNGRGGGKWWRGPRPLSPSSKCQHSGHMRSDGRATAKIVPVVTGTQIAVLLSGERALWILLAIVAIVATISWIAARSGAYLSRTRRSGSEEIQESWSVGFREGLRKSTGGEIY